MGKYTIPVFVATGIGGILTGVFAWLYGAFYAEWMRSCAITFGICFYHLAMRLLVGLAVRPVRKWDSRWFCQRFWEPKLYQALGVKRWKKHIPTFFPKQFSLKENTMEQIIRNGCRAEIIHEFIVILSFLPVLTIPYFGAAGVFWATSLASALFDGCVAILQRYNRPRFQRILAREASRL